MSLGKDVEQRLKKAGTIIASNASAQRKEKAHAGVALLSISDAKINLVTWVWSA